MSVCIRIYVLSVLYLHIRKTLHRLRITLFEVSVFHFQPKKTHTQKGFSDFRYNDILGNYIKILGPFHLKMLSAIKTLTYLKQTSRQKHLFCLVMDSFLNFF